MSVGNLFLLDPTEILKIIDQLIEDEANVKYEIGVKTRAWADGIMDGLERARATVQNHINEKKAEEAMKRANVEEVDFDTFTGESYKPRPESRL